MAMESRSSISMIVCGDSNWNIFKNEVRLFSCTCQIVLNNGSYIIAHQYIEAETQWHFADIFKYITGNRYFWLSNLTELFQYGSIWQRVSIACRDIYDKIWITLGSRCCRGVSKIHLRILGSSLKTNLNIIDNSQFFIIILLIKLFHISHIIKNIRYKWIHTMYYISTDTVASWYIATHYILIMRIRKSCDHMNIQIYKYFQSTTAQRQQ